MGFFMPFLALPVFAAMLLVKRIAVAAGRRFARRRVRALMAGPDPASTDPSLRLEQLSHLNPGSALARAGRRLETASILWHLVSGGWLVYCLSFAVTAQFLLGRFERNSIAGRSLALMALLLLIDLAVIAVTLWSLRPAKRERAWRPAVCCALVALVIVIMSSLVPGLLVSPVIIAVSLLSLSWRAFRLREAVVKERTALTLEASSS
jgi:hypothetical protein